MKYLGTTTNSNSIVTKQYVDQHSAGGGTAPSFEVMIINGKLVVRNIDPSLSGMQPVIFRRIKTAFDLKDDTTIRKKGWIAPYYSRVDIAEDGTVSYTPQDVKTADCPRVEISSSPDTWTQEKAHCFCWGTRSIRKYILDSDGVKVRRRVVMRYGMAFCRPTDNGYGQKAYNAVTEIVPFKVANGATTDDQWSTSFVK